ncbi:TPA: LysR family transcriptional regulator, partial [Klebsiella pneumoniae]|nr:LysR family transcriptional regulator [Klebsiella pneumoniae]
MCRVAAATYPAYGPCDQLLIYPLARLKLPVL